MKISIHSCSVSYILFSISVVLSLISRTADICMYNILSSHRIGVVVFLWTCSKYSIKYHFHRLGLGPNRWTNHICCRSYGVRFVLPQWIWHASPWKLHGSIHIHIKVWLIRSTSHLVPFPLILYTSFKMHSITLHVRVVLSDTYTSMCVSGHWRVNSASL